MLLKNMPQSAMDLGEFKRQDGEKFKVKAVLYISPEEYDYWVAIFDVVHPTWRHMAFKAVIPKKIAATAAIAGQYIGGPIADQVRASVGGSTSDGRDFEVVFSTDGWSLL